MDSRAGGCLRMEGVATLTALPDTFPAGTTVKYTRSLSDYPATSGWTLKLLLAGAGTHAEDAVANGDAFDVTLTAAETAALPPGDYRWVERVEKGGEVYDVATGVVTVTPNLATATPGSLQSWEEKELAAVEAAIAAILAGGIAAYQIAGRAVTKVDLPTLQKLRASLRTEIARQRGQAPGRQWKFTFTGTANE